MNCADDLTSVDLDASVDTLQISSASTSSTISLYPFILQSGSYTLNAEDTSHLQRILRPLDSKDTVKTNEEIEGAEEGEARDGNWNAGSLDSHDGDEELLIHVRFSELVRIKSLLIGTGGGRLPTSPRLARVWVNRSNGISFDETSTVKGAQEWELLENENGSRGAVEYPVRISKFANVSELDLFFSNTRSEQTRLFYLGFMGESRQLKKEPGEPMTVGAENAAPSLLDGMKEEKRGANQTSAR
ncbi:PITH domain-containing protein [Sporobolomyces salmoneus]|uniref:PITH domain-containing protein n=1 Tax=Sporobolomyces salmoneus TaxID=183962 RepID=UPI003170F4AE